VKVSGRSSGRKCDREAKQTDQFAHAAGRFANASVQSTVSWMMITGNNRATEAS